MLAVAVERKTIKVWGLNSPSDLSLTSYFWAREVASMGLYPDLRVRLEN